VAREQTAQQLKTSAEERALRQYVSILAVQADMVGVDLQDAQSPLVQEQNGKLVRRRVSREEKPR
jgi:peptidyl-prolyl cis-trans isomerase C